uniref:Coiled-coil-helix-coiled-coil-helix domain-containing protein 7 n=1 Tax=Ornithodoros turicata TaxID=34597 RepID=A0A2R5L9R9_9ACAR
MTPSDASQRRKKAENASSEDHNNPCLKEQKLSFKCLDDNLYDKDKCTRYFENYKKCQGFWLSIAKERRRNGIRPYLPPVEEREEIKRKHFEQTAS